MSLANYTLTEYMGLPLYAYNVLLPTLPAGAITYTDEGFRLRLRLDDVPNMSSVLDGLSVDCEVAVAHDPSRRRNVLKAKRFRFVLDEARLAEDLAFAAQDVKALDALRTLTEESVAARRVSAAGSAKTSSAAAGAAAGAGTDAGVEAAKAAAAAATATAKADARTAAIANAARKLGSDPAASDEFMGLTGRILTRMLALANIELDGEAVVTWKGPADHGAQAVTFRAEGKLEFTVKGVFAWFPSLFVNTVGSKIASQVLKYLIPRFIRFIKEDYEKWATGTDRQMQPQIKTKSSPEIYDLPPQVRIA